MPTMLTRTSINQALWTVLYVLVLSACSGSGGGKALPSAQVSLTVDGSTQVFQTTERKVAEILAIAEVELAPGDRLLLAGTPYSLEQDLPESSVYLLQVRRAIAVTLITDEGSRIISSAATTLAGALLDGGLSLYTSDRLDPPPQTALSASLTATLVRALPIQITINRQIVFARSAAPTVGLALAEVGLSLQGSDYSLPPASDPIPADGNIRVVRITEEVIIQQEPIPFSAIFQASAEVDIDTVQVMQTGEYGVRSQRVRIRYEDGVEVARQVEDEWVAREPLPRILGYGTKVTILSMQTPNGPIEYWRAIEVYATSYAAKFTERSPDDPAYGIMFNGKLLHTGYIAVLRSWYNCMAPYQYYIPNYGFGLVGDIGAGIEGKAWIDLGFSDDEYVAWYSWTTLYFLTPKPPDELIQWILPTSSWTASPC